MILKGLLNIILRRYFLFSRCLIFITDGENTVDPPVEIPMVNINIFEGNFSEKTNILFNSFGCQDFILNVNSPVSVLRSIELEIKLHDDRFNKRKFVFIPGNEEYQNTFDIFEENEIKFISDLLVIYEEIEIVRKSNNALLDENIDRVFSLWTHNYVGLYDNNKYYLLDKWFSENNSFLYENNLFPDKLTNQEGRILKTAVFQYEPYVIAETTKDKTYKLMGSEMVTMFTFSRHHNMSIFPVINENDYWGEIWDNWTGNGLMGNIVEDNADIGADALYTWASIYRFLDLSKPTVRTGITCLVPAPKLAAGWLTPLYAYAPTTWLAVMVVFAVSVFTIFLFETIQLLPEYKEFKHLRLFQHSKVRMFGKALLSVGKPFIMQNVTDQEMIKGNLGRYLMGLVFIITLVLSTTYDSGLATIMTIPRYENPINTVDEFVASGLAWGGTQEAWTTSIAGAKEEKYKKIVSRFVATSEERLRKFSLTGDFAFSVERLPKDNFAVGTYIKEDVIQNFHLMSEDLYWEQCVIMTRKNSVLLPLIDMFVLKVFEAGLISFWQNEAATSYMNQYVQKAVKYFFHHQKERGIIKLKMVHVEGAFGILCFGCILACAVFLLELLHSRYFKSI